MIWYTVHKFYSEYSLPNVIVEGLPLSVAPYDTLRCIREDKSNFLIHTNFLLPLGTETTIENGCLKVILVDVTTSGKGSIYFSFIWTFRYVLA